MYKHLTRDDRVGCGYLLFVREQLFVVATIISTVGF